VSAGWQFGTPWQRGRQRLSGGEIAWPARPQRLHQVGHAQLTVAAPPLAGSVVADAQPVLRGPCSDASRVSEVEEGVDDFLVPLVAALAISPFIPFSFSSSQVFCESYPAPRWTVISSGSGPISSSFLSVGARRGRHTGSPGPVPCRAGCRSPRPGATGFMPSFPRSTKLLLAHSPSTSPPEPAPTAREPDNPQPPDLPTPTLTVDSTLTVAASRCPMPGLRPIFGSPPGRFQDHRQEPWEYVE